MNFDNELERIKNKALAVNHALELSKAASVANTKQNVAQELEAVAKGAKDCADVQVAGLKKVESASEKSSKGFADSWKQAFAQTENEAFQLGASLFEIFSNSRGDIKSGLLDMVTSKSFIDNTVGLLGGVFGGAFADGGRPDPNKVSLVGERGPELFVPDVAGSVVPNESILGQNSPQMSPIVVNQQFTFQSLDPVTNMRMLQAQKTQIQNWVIDGIKSNTNGLRNVIEGV